MHASVSSVALVLTASLITAIPQAARAQVHKCVSPTGAIAFQSRPCPEQWSSTDVELEAPPPSAEPVPSEDGSDAGTKAQRLEALKRHLRDAAPEPAPKEEPRLPYGPRSWRCESTDRSEVWYLHKPCPPEAVRMVLDSGGLTKIRIQVRGREISRAEACKAIKEGAATRSGSARDQHPSPYDRLRGDDDC